MTNDNITIYAEFLARCRQAAGPFDLERLASDEQYKAEFYMNVALSGDDELFKLAALVSSKLNDERQSLH